MLPKISGALYVLQEIWTFYIKFIIFGRFLKPRESGNPQGSAKGRLNQKGYNETDIELDPNMS